MPALPADGLRGLLDDGLAAGLFSGAAAGVLTPAGRATAYAGVHAFGDRRGVDETSLFDLASVSKTATAAAVLRLVRAGSVRLDDRVADVVPVADPAITLRMLLTHTSGLPAESFLWRDAPGIPAAQRLDTVLATPLESAPDAVHRYSCLGYIAAGAYAERVTGVPLADLIREHVAGPTGAGTLGFGPVDPTTAVATEEEPWAGRGLVRGEVHDELNWFLGGRVGNAGLFGTAEDVLALAAGFLDDALLGPELWRAATTDQLEPRHDAPYGQALGPRVRDPDLFGGADAIGHGGFTGTMWIAIPDRGIAGALLTNRVHPNRDRVDLGPFRRRFSEWAATL
jgi:CubicO group peptidase (beta-lactamase class C family)